MHLIEKYSLNCGISPAKLGKPYIYTSYYPVNADKYIVIHPSSGMSSKNYSYYQEVVDFIHEPASKAGYKIVQIGDEKDQNLSKCINLQGKTNIHQTCFVLKNSCFFIGNDSFSTHVASSYGIPLVSLYSVIQPEVAGPYWNNGKQFSIMAPLEGKKPKYAAEDPERIIDKIKPEEIIRVINKSLPDIELSHLGKLESIFFGKNYPKILIEFVPDKLVEVDIAKEFPLNIRFDYLNGQKDISEENINSALINILKRKSVVITSRPFNIDNFKIDNIKQNVVSFVFHIEKKYLNKINESKAFVDKVTKLGINIKVAIIKEEFSEEEIADIKFKFLNVQYINCLTQTSWENTISEESKNKINNLTIFKSSRIIFSNGNAFLSKTALMENKPCKNSVEQPLSDIEDLLSLGKELENCYIYNL
jgi:hypothetical protein